MSVFGSQRATEVQMPVQGGAPRVVAVVVAYNRRALLVEVLDALAQQTVAPVETVVVDNASDDGSGEAAAEHPLGVDLVSLPRNTGGAGGFAVGIARAMAVHAPDWVWIMDDDTVPAPSALEGLLAAVDGSPARVAAGSRAVWTDGRDHPMNTPRRKPFVSPGERREAREAGVLPVRSASFVSLLISADTVRERGLPIADYFIWNDDFEYSTRLMRRRRGVFVPESVVVHKTKRIGSTDVDPGDRFFYEVRNKLWLFRGSRGLNPAEKLLYGGSTLVRWVRTFVRSGDRARLRRALRAGLRDGLRTRPRPNAETLAGLGDASRLVAEFEAQRADRVALGRPAGRGGRA